MIKSAATLLLVPVFLGAVACSTASTTRTAANEAAPPGGLVLRDTSPVMVPRDPDATVWASRTPAPEWFTLLSSITSRDQVVGHSAKLPSRESALEMARLQAMAAAADQIASKVISERESSDSSSVSSTPTGDMHGASAAAFRSRASSAARNNILGARVEDDYYERFWSQSGGWSWKAHVLLRYDYQRSVSAAQGELAGN